MAELAASNSALDAMRVQNAPDAIAKIRCGLAFSRPSRDIYIVLCRKAKNLKADLKKSMGLVKRIKNLTEEVRRVDMFRHTAFQLPSSAVCPLPVSRILLCRVLIRSRKILRQSTSLGTRQKSPLPS